MDIIKSIRRDQGLDIQVAEPDAKAAIQHLRRNLENALHNLSEDLYSKSTHFLLEFIQNADDNSYPQGVQPALEIQLLDQNMTIKCNEGGFSDRDVRAICSVGESTKKNQLGYIGIPSLPAN
ncbi:hypothetical protein PHLCEN_2v5472 [Hermanssonia centrifuga]|uniref:Uncharacterized protein n=1 Tax=Hermanssonia centrifuga TaxID=98765 RepID=A0A2R6P2F8_9APHY|nr:hypothetical protein PHLCEN_2v5472 [Hermanssonia centrifuga]